MLGNRSLQGTAELNAGHWPKATLPNTEATHHGDSPSLNYRCISSLTLAHFKCLPQTEGATCDRRPSSPTDGLE